MRVDVEGIDVELAGRRILEGVNATVSESSFIGLVGPNGVGKTTLLRVINGAIDGDGKTVVGGDDISSLSVREVSRRVTTTPQNTDVAFEFSVEEVVRMGRHPHVDRFGTDTSDAVERAMERVDVKKFADRSIHEVSGGERQRVLLARSLAQEAPVFLLDEPTASLDLSHAVRILEVVRSVVTDGKTAVAAIHDLNLAARFCDEVFLLREGSVVSSGKPEDVLTEENIESVFGTPVHVGKDTATGAVRVTPLSEGSAMADGEVSVHLGVDDVDLFHALRKAGYEVTVGVVPEGSATARACRARGTQVVTAEPFGKIPHETIREATTQAEDAEAVLGEVAPSKKAPGGDVSIDTEDTNGTVESVGRFLARLD